MKPVAVLLTVSLIATGSATAGQRRYTTAYGRVNEDVPAAGNDRVCVYADVWKTGKKTIVCGDPAPKSEGVTVTNATVATAATEPPAEDAAARARPAEKCSGDKRKTPHSASAQPQREQRVHYVRPAADAYRTPQVYYRPFGAFQKPDDTAARPLCLRYDGGGPATLFRIADATRFVHDLPPPPPPAYGRVETYGRPITAVGSPVPVITRPFFRADYGAGVRAYPGRSGHGRYDAHPDRLQFDGHVHAPDAGGGPKPDASSGGNVMADGPPAESALDALNVKRSSDAPTSSDPADDNGAQPTQQKKTEIMTRN